MAKGDIVNVTIRLNKGNRKQKEVYEILQNFEQSIFKSKIAFIVEALLHYDEYLKSEIKDNEEQEKQRKFLNQITKTVQESIRVEYEKYYSQIHNERQEEKQEDRRNNNDIETIPDVDIDSSVANFLNNL